jgi:hypothetical protein
MGLGSIQYNIMKRLYWSFNSGQYLKNFALKVQSISIYFSITFNHTNFQFYQKFQLLIILFKKVKMYMKRSKYVLKILEFKLQHF